MKERVTGLDWMDFVNLNTALDALQDMYKKHAESPNTSLTEFWVKEIKSIQKTRSKLKHNRKYE